MEANHEIKTEFTTALETVIRAVEQAYNIRLAGITPTPDGSSLTDFEAKEGQTERLAELLGFHVQGNESLCYLAGRTIQNRVDRLIQNLKDRFSEQLGAQMSYEHTIVLLALEEAYGVRHYVIKTNPDGTSFIDEPDDYMSLSLTDLPAKEGALERLSELLGIEVDGSEDFAGLAYNLAHKKVETRDEFKLLFSAF
jgi:antitoxin component HigA of HigAB toxin-antitoxin module